MKKHECACNEYRRLSRRGFLATSFGTMAAITTPAWLPRVAYAQSANSARDVVVSIFLRGGIDGLTAVVPHGDENYYRWRRRTAVDRPGQNNGAVDLDGFFGLAPGMSALKPAYDAGDLLAVHATGSTDDTRSHFDAQRFMEIGKPGDLSLFTGWLGRYLMDSAPVNSASVIRAIGLSDALPIALSGASEALPVPNPGEFQIEGEPETADERLALLLELYAAGMDPLKNAAENTSRTIDQLNAINFEGYTPAGGATYPDNEIGFALRSAAALIKADLGVEALTIDYDGWDTHILQGSTSGNMHRLMEGLSQSLAAFHTDVIAPGANVTVVVLSEFGRTVEENGGAGTDHGHGNCMFVLSRAANGGQVLADWPGLAREQLYEGQDLEVTIDYRDVLADVLTQRLGVNDTSFVLPGYTPTPRGMFA